MLVFFLHFPFVFICKNNIVATDIFHKLVLTARLYMKKASWSYCVLKYDSSGEPVPHPAVSDFCVLGGSGTEFEVGRSTSRKEGADATTNAPMDLESSMGDFYFCVRPDLSRYTSLLYFRST